MEKKQQQQLTFEIPESHSCHYRVSALLSHVPKWMKVKTFEIYIRTLACDSHSLPYAQYPYGALKVHKNSWKDLDFVFGKEKEKPLP